MRDLKELEEKIVNLESMVERLQNPVIGVAWCNPSSFSCNSVYSLYSVEDGTGLGRFKHFTKKDITDNINGYIKICSTWFFMMMFIINKKMLLKKGKLKRNGIIMIRR